MSPLHAIEFRSSNSMAGINFAVMVDGVAHVSPAIWSLMKDASSEELHHLLSHLRFIELPPLTSLFQPLPPSFDFKSDFA